MVIIFARCDIAFCYYANYLQIFPFCSSFFVLRMLQSTNDVKQKIQKTTIVSQHQEITISLLTHPLFFCKILLLLLFYLSIFIDRHLLRCLCCHIAFVFYKTRCRYCPYLCFYGSFLLSWMLRSPNEAKQNIQDAK